MEVMGQRLGMPDVKRGSYDGTCCSYTVGEQDDRATLVLECTVQTR